MLLFCFPFTEILKRKKSNDLNMSYIVKGRIEYQGESIPVLGPDHVSLGKCVISRHFVRKYSSINDLEIQNLLKDGCLFKGYKKVKSESAEEEAFANMHFVLLLSNLDDTIHKQVCIRRMMTIQIHMDRFEGIKTEVLTSSTVSSVIINIDKKNEQISIFHFKKKTMKTIILPLMENQHERQWKFELVSDVLYIDNKNLHFVNFNYSEPYYRKINLGSNEDALVYSNEVVVILNKDPALAISPEPPIILCDMLRRQTEQRQIVITYEILSLFLNNFSSVHYVNGKFVWIIYYGPLIHIYVSKIIDGFVNVGTINTLELFSNCQQSFFKTACYSSSTNQLYIVYYKTNLGDMSSSIVCLDLNSHLISYILDLQYTSERRPEIIMQLSQSGHKLFVQETFEEKLIFYQVFRLPPARLTLQNITKQYIWENLSEELLLNTQLPKSLQDELVVGF